MYITYKETLTLVLVSQKKTSSEWHIDRLPQELLAVVPHPLDLEELVHLQQAFDVLA